MAVIDKSSSAADKDSNLVLLVDDTPDYRQSTRDLLQGLGYTVVEATDAASMHGKLEVTGMQFKAVFLDQKLGNDPRKGLELLSEIKQKYPELAVIMYTGTLDDLGKEAISRGAYWYLSKLYVSPYELANILDNVVRMRSLRDERAILFEENEFLRTVLDAVDQEIMVRKPDGTILWVNKAQLEAYPDLATALKNGPVICFKFWEGPERESFCEECVTERAVRTRKIQKGSFYRDDADLDQEITGVPIVLENGNVSCVVELVRDVTRSRKLHEFAERVVALEEADEESFWDQIAEYVKELLHFRRVRVYRVASRRGLGRIRILKCVATRGYERAARNPKGGELPFFGTLQCKETGSGILEPEVTTLEAHPDQHRAQIVKMIDPDREWMLIPIRYEGELQWQISVDTKGLPREFHFSSTDLEAARFVARVVSDAISNRQLREDLQWIRELQRVLDTAHDMKAAANGLLAAAKEKRLCDFGKVVVPTYDRKRLRTLATDDHTAHCGMCARGQGLDTGLNGQVFSSGVAEFVEEALKHRLIRRYRSKHKKDFACERCAKTPVMAALPLRVSDDIIGILDVFFDTQHSFSDREKRLLNELACVLSSSLLIARRIEKAQNVILQTYALASRSFVLGGMAHRIRGSFGGLLAGLDSLVLQDLSPEEARTTAKELKVIVRSLKKIFDKAMVFRRAGLPKPELLNVCEVVDEIVKNTNLGNRNVKVTLSTSIRKAKSTPLVKFTRESLDMALQSLLQNAYDAVVRQQASRRDGDKQLGIIRVSVDVNGAFVVVKVKDNGPGFPEGIVIDPWYPLEQPQRGHSGMGLYFANWALDSMGGRLEIGRTAAGWTVVTAHIPLHRERQDG